MSIYDEIEQDNKNLYEFWKDKLYYLDCELIKVSRWPDNTELLANTKLGALNYLFSIKNIVLEIEKAMEGEKIESAVKHGFLEGISFKR